jgi:polyphosphate glucokinase
MTRERVVAAAERLKTIAAQQNAPFTLAVDVGGSHIKADVLNGDGYAVATQRRAPTPKKATPNAVLESIAFLAGRLPQFDRISVGFPGVVKCGQVVTAPNLGTRHWRGFRLEAALSERFGKPVRVLNDAAVQGLGVVKGHGLECVLTLGTGVGCALFLDRRLLLHLELGQHRARKGKTYDQYAGQAALRKVGTERWNRRIRKVIEAVSVLTVCDKLYIGGGNARLLNVPVPSHVTIVSNTAGVLGGIRLWETGAIAIEAAGTPRDGEVHTHTSPPTQGEPSPHAVGDPVGAAARSVNQ